MVDLLDLHLSRTHAQAHRHAGRHACTQTHTRALTHFCTFFFFLSLSHKSLFLSLEKLERKDIAIVSLLLQTHEQTSSKYLTVYSPSIDREGNVTNRRFWGIAPKEHKTAVFHSGLVYFLVYIYIFTTDIRLCRRFEISRTRRYKWEAYIYPHEDKRPERSDRKLETAA